MTDSIVGLIVVAMLALMAGGFLWAVNDCLNTVIYQKQKKKMFKSLENILLSHYHSDNTAMCFEEIGLIFKHIVEMNVELKRNYTSVDILLEKYLIELNASN